MNKLIKIILAILGACNLMMSAFIPIAVALMMIKFYGLSGFTLYSLLIIGILATLFRSLKPTIQLQNGG